MCIHTYLAELFQTFVVFAGLLALASGMPQELVSSVPLAPTLVRAPAHDSASIESHRLGGNFAYAVAEAHAFAKVRQIKPLQKDFLIGILH